MLASLINFIAPADCALCHKPNEFVCQECINSHFTSKVPSCFYCNRLTNYGEACKTCQRKTSLRGVYVLWRLDGSAKDLVYRLKYKNDRGLAKFLARQLSARFDLVNYDLITWVASDGKALRQRGYNQAELLGRALGRDSGLVARPTLLRIKHTSQTHLNRAKRFVAVQGNFVCYRSKNIVGKRVLIVDDVLTTSATMGECARVLKLAGAKQVWGIVVAKK